VTTAAPRLAWSHAAARLGDQLAAAGKLTDPAWHAAVAAVPRHRLVPRFHIQDDHGCWSCTDTRTAPVGEWLDRVYGNTVLITDLRRVGGVTEVVSSSSQPGLMVRMLEALGIAAGQRVLEIGTGTGYNAALLCHRLGDEHVFSVDVEPDLVDHARTRLAELGYRPTLHAGDGARGLPEHAPFDRIIATCAVPAVPWAWVEQLRIGGRLLTDLKIAHGAGSLVQLTRTGPDTAVGRFDPTYAAFMDLRPAAAATPAPRRPRGPVTARRATTVDPRTPWTSLVVWFLAALDLGPDVSVGYAGGGPGRPPQAVRIATADGSWADVDVEPDADGSHLVVEGGPRTVWRIVEDAHRLWVDHDRPGWERLGLTVTAGRQTVWLDDPLGGPSWPLREALPPTLG